MKKVIIAVAAFIAVAFVFFGVKYSWFSTHEFQITHEYSQEEIDNLKDDLSEKDIDLEINNLAFDEDGKLTQISGHTSFNNGSSLSFSSENLKKVTVKKGLFASCGVKVENLN